MRLTALWLLTNLGFLFFWPTKWPQYILALTVPAALGAAFWLAGAWPRWRSRRRATPAERKELRRAGAPGAGRDGAAGREKRLPLAAGAPKGKQ